MIEGIIKDFKDPGYSKISIPFSNEYFMQAGNAFLEALNIDEKLKKSLQYFDDPLDTATLGGFMQRDRKKGNFDTKEYIHYTERFENEFKDIIQNCKDDRLSNFLTYAREINGNGIKNYKNVVKELDFTYPCLYDSYFPQGKSNFKIILRFICYYSNKGGEFLAKPHYDRGAISTALFESSPGLLIGSKEQLNAFQHNEYEALLFPSKFFNKYIDTEIQGLWHSVEQKDQDRVSDKVARWAIVMFSSPLEGGKVTFEDTRALK